MREKPTINRQEIQYMDLLQYALEGLDYIMDRMRINPEIETERDFAARHAISRGLWDVGIDPDSLPISIYQRLVHDVAREIHSSW